MIIDEENKNINEKEKDKEKENVPLSKKNSSIFNRSKESSFKIINTSNSSISISNDNNSLLGLNESINTNTSFNTMNQSLLSMNSSMISSLTDSLNKENIQEGKNVNKENITTKENSKENLNKSNKLFVVYSEEENIANNNIFDVKFLDSKEKVSYVGEYLEELYLNLLEEEQNLQVRPVYGYMDSQTNINSRMRAILIDWIIEVHFRLGLIPETLYQTIWIIDTYLSICYISREKLQLLGIAALFIAWKSNEIQPPEAKEFVKMTKNAYKKEELLQMEEHVLNILDFNTLAPTANDFYNIIAKVFNFDELQYNLGKYFLESSLLDYGILTYPSSVVGVACAYIVMKYLGVHNYKSLYSNDIIRLSTPQKIIKEAARDICFLVKNLSQVGPTISIQAVQEKYSLPKFNNVAQMCN